MGRVGRNSEFSASENVDCNASENGTYDVKEVTTTTGARVLGFPIGVGSGLVEAGEETTKLDPSANNVGKMANTMPLDCSRGLFHA